MSAAGFHADPDVIETYSEDLGQYSEQGTRIKGLVAQADVGDESWGVVGIFTKQIYTQALNQLQEQMQSMIDGVGSAVDAFGATAREYRTAEEETARKLSDILTGLDERSPAPDVRRV